MKRNFSNRGKSGSPDLPFSLRIFLVAQVFAIGVGPTAIALGTDYVFGDDAALRWSMAIVAGSCCVLALLIMLWGRPAYRDSVLRARQWQPVRKN